MNTAKRAFQNLSVNSRGAMMAMASAINKAGAEDVPARTQGGKPEENEA